tara:strand:- start:389 stop:493 length:105 start_codon:yes stop_codon:yes gene_type:complete
MNWLTRGDLNENGLGDRLELIVLFTSSKAIALAG